VVVVTLLPTDVLLDCLATVVSGCCGFRPTAPAGRTWLH